MLPYIVALPVVLCVSIVPMSHFIYFLVCACQVYWNVLLYTVRATRSLSVPHIFAATYDPPVHHVCKPLRLYQPWYKWPKEEGLHLVL